MRKHRRLLDKFRRQLYFNVAKKGILSVTISTLITLFFISGFSFAVDTTTTSIDMGENSATKTASYSIEVKNKSQNVPDTGDPGTGDHGFFSIEKDPDVKSKTVSVFLPIITFLSSSAIIYLALNKFKKTAWKNRKFSSALQFLSLGPNQSSLHRIKNPSLLVAIVFGFGVAAPLFLSANFLSIADTSSEISDYTAYEFKEKNNPFPISLSLTEPNIQVSGSIEGGEESFSELYSEKEKDALKDAVVKGDYNADGLLINVSTINPTGSTLSLDIATLDKLKTKDGDTIPSIENVTSVFDFIEANTSAFGFVVAEFAGASLEAKYINPENFKSSESSAAVIPASKLNDVIEGYLKENNYRPQKLAFIVLVKTNSKTKAGTYTFDLKFTAKTRSINSQFAYYNISYDYDGCDATTPVLGYIPAGRKLNVEPTCLPEKEGATFLGWTTSDKKVFEETEANFEYDPAKRTYKNTPYVFHSPQTVLYPVWRNEEVTYTLKFDANINTEPTETQPTIIGMPTVDPITNTSGSATFTIPSTIPTRQGYTFTMWADMPRQPIGCSLDECLTWHTYAPGDQITIKGSDTKQTLYAIWQENTPEPPITYTYSLTFDAKDYQYSDYYGDNNGTHHDGPTVQPVSTTTQTESYEYNIPTDDDHIPLLAGYRFTGWSDTSDNHYSFDQATKTFTPSKIALDKDHRNLTLYAVWEFITPTYYLAYDVTTNLPTGCTLSGSITENFESQTGLSEGTNEVGDAEVVTYGVKFANGSTTFDLKPELSCSSHKFVYWAAKDAPTIRLGGGNNLRVRREFSDVRQNDKYPKIITHVVAVYAEETEEDTSGLHSSGPSTLSLSHVQTILGIPTDSVDDETEESENSDAEPEEKPKDKEEENLTETQPKKAEKKTENKTPETDADKDAETENKEKLKEETDSSGNTILFYDDETTSAPYYAKPLGVLEESTDEESDNNIVTFICISVLIVSGLGITGIILFPLLTKNHSKKQKPTRF